jgi:hypothetical protein
MGRRLLIRILSSLAISTTLSTLIFFFTPFPLEVVARRFSSENFRIDGVHGSLYFGGVYDQVTITEPNTKSRLVATKVRFRMRPADLVIGRRLAFADYSIDSVKVSVTELPPVPLLVAGAAAWAMTPSDPKAAPAVQVREVDPEKALPSTGIAAVDHLAPQIVRLGLVLTRFLLTGEKPWFKAVGIDELRIGKTEVRSEGAGGTTSGFSLDSIRMSGAYYRLHEKRFSLDEIAVIDPKKELRFKGLSVGKQGLGLAETAVRLRKEFAPDVLANDIDLRAVVDGNLKEIATVKASIEAFGGKAKGSIGPAGAVSLVFTDFNPRDFFAIPLPISKASFEIYMNLLLGTPPTTSGDFRIDQATFRFGERPFEAGAIVGERAYAVRIDPMKLVTGDRTALSLSSNASGSAQDSLALLRHSLPYADLDEASRTMVDSDLAFFDRSVPPYVRRTPASSPAP